MVLFPIKWWPAITNKMFTVKLFCLEAWFYDLQSACFYVFNSLMQKMFTGFSACPLQDVKVQLALVYIENFNLPAIKWRAGIYLSLWWRAYICPYYKLFNSSLLTSVYGVIGLTNSCISSR